MGEVVGVDVSVAIKIGIETAAVDRELQIKKFLLAMFADKRVAAAVGDGKSELAAARDGASELRPNAGAAVVVLGEERAGVAVPAEQRVDCADRGGFGGEHRVGRQAGKRKKVDIAARKSVDRVVEVDREAPTDPTAIGKSMFVGHVGLQCVGKRKFVDRVVSCVEDFDDGFVTARLFMIADKVEIAVACHNQTDAAVRVDVDADEARGIAIAEGAVVVIVVDQIVERIEAVRIERAPSFFAVCSRLSREKNGSR